MDEVREDFNPVFHRDVGGVWILFHISETREVFLWPCAEMNFCGEGGRGGGECGEERSETRQFVKTKNLMH